MPFNKSHEEKELSSRSNGENSPKRKASHGWGEGYNDPANHSEDTREASSRAAADNTAAKSSTLLGKKRVTFDLSKNQEAPREEDPDGAAKAARLSEDFAKQGKESARLNKELQDLGRALTDPAHSLHNTHDVKYEYERRYEAYKQVTEKDFPTDVDSPDNWDHMIDAAINQNRNSGKYTKDQRHEKAIWANKENPDFQTGKSHRQIEEEAARIGSNLGASGSIEPEPGKRPRRRHSVYIPAEKQGGRSL